MIPQALVALSLFFGLTLVESYSVQPQIINARQTLDGYDYVIVGGGNAGSTIASRLAEDPHVTVLLIEAGSLDQSEGFITIPRRAGDARGTKYDWNFTTVPQEFVGGRTIAIPAGKVIGGGTVLNGMAYDRGSASDYDAWADLGNRGWDWKGLLPFFKKNERFVPPPKEFAEKYNITWDLDAHGTDGPIYAAYPTVLNPLNAQWIDGLKSIGIPLEKDGHNGRALNNFYSPNALDPRTMTRSYAKIGYYLPATSKHNFHSLLETTVTKLVTVKGPGGIVKVTNIEYASSATAAVQSVKVKKEAIVSSGTIGSPRILQVSGIGPAAHLKSLGVPVVVDLPGVGSNYQDHAFEFFFATLTTPPPPAPTGPLSPEDEYNLNRTGPWTQSGPTLFSFLPFKTISDKYAKILSDYRSQDPVSHLWAGVDKSVVAGYRLQQSVLAKRLATDLMAVTEFIWSGGGTLYSAQHPLSRGFVRIKTVSAFDAPTIDLRYGSNPIDFDLLAESVRWLRKAYATPALAALGPVELLPGPNVTTDEELKTFNAGQMTTMFHSCCTNPLQPKDKGGVVDGNLKVYGTSNLRVVDASVIPLIPATHIQSTVYAIAEKLADLVKGGH